MKKIINRIYKLVWVFVYHLMINIHTFIFKLKLRLNGVEYGKNIRANGGSSPSLRISVNAKQVKIGDNFTAGNFSDAGWCSKCGIYVKSGASLIIGSNSGINGCLIYCSNSISIGDYVNIGGETRIIDTDFHPLDYLLRRTGISGTKSSPVIIDDDVFIGTNCIICKGVHIGARSIVAAGSVVVKDIPADEVWGGNPAHFIRNNNNLV